MSHIIRQQPDGNWCLYSTDTESFLVYNATRGEIIEWKVKQFRENLEMDLDTIEENGYIPPETQFTAKIEEFVESDDSIILEDDGSLTKV